LGQCRGSTPQEEVRDNFPPLPQVPLERLAGSSFSRVMYPFTPRERICFDGAVFFRGLDQPQGRGVSPLSEFFFVGRFSPGWSNGPALSGRWFFNLTPASHPVALACSPAKTLSLIPQDSRTVFSGTPPFLSRVFFRDVAHRSFLRGLLFFFFQKSPSALSIETFFLVPGDSWLAGSFSFPRLMGNFRDFFCFGVV